MRFIKDLTEGERINEIYLCRKKQSALTKAHTNPMSYPTKFQVG